MNPNTFQRTQKTLTYNRHRCHSIRTVPTTHFKRARHTIIIMEHAHLLVSLLFDGKYVGMADNNEGLILSHTEPHAED